MKSFFIGAFAAIAACVIFFAALYGWHRLTRPEEYTDTTEGTAATTTASSNGASGTEAVSSEVTARTMESSDYRQGYDDGYQAALTGNRTSASATGTGSGSAMQSAPAEDLTLYNETVMSEHRTPKNPAYGQTLTYAEAWSSYGDGTLPGEDASSLTSYDSDPALSDSFTPENDLYSGENPDTLSGDPVLPAEEWIPVPAYGIP